MAVSRQGHHAILQHICIDAALLTVVWAVQAVLVCVCVLSGGVDEKVACGHAHTDMCLPPHLLAQVLDAPGAAV